MDMSAVETIFGPAADTGAPSVAEPEAPVEGDAAGPDAARDGDTSAGVVVAEYGPATDPPVAAPARVGADEDDLDEALHAVASRPAHPTTTRRRRSIMTF
jgi:hypothetical protein